MMTSPASIFDLTPPNIRPPGVTSKIFLPCPQIEEPDVEMLEIYDPSDFCIQLTTTDHDEWAWNTDSNIIAEMWKMIHEDVDKKKGQVLDELAWTNIGVGGISGEACSRSMWTWFDLDGDKPGMTIDGLKIEKTRVPWDIEECLTRFDEDWEFEEWYKDHDHLKAIEEFNRHRLLAIENPEDVYQTGVYWCGKVNGCPSPFSIPHALKREDRTVQSNAGVKTTFYRWEVRDRYNIPVKVVTNHPADRRGYAKGSTEFGDVYIPDKFKETLPPIGEMTMMTIALQDVGGQGNTKKPNAFKWTAIYQHDGKKKK